MKIKHLLKTIAFSAFLLTGCSNLDQIIEYQSNDQGSVYQTIYYTASFLNYDESFLYSTKVKEGQFATYNGPTPTRESTSLYRYTFAGWDKPLSQTPIYLDTTFIAKYEEKIITYYNVQFVDYDGTLLYETTVEEGKDAVYVGETPHRESANGYNYTFAGWNKSTTSITEDSVFVATYISKRQNLCVRFLNYDETVLDICYVEYGEAAIYAGKTPTRPAEGQYSFTFVGWDKDYTAIKENTDIHAKYRSDTRSFTVSFLNYDGSLLYKTTVNYGGNAVYAALSQPSRPVEGRYQYDFTGWSGPLDEIYSDTQVTAQYVKRERDSTSGLIYRYDNALEGYFVTGYSGSEKNVFIGKKYQDAKIIGIDSGAFQNNRNITTLFIEDNVKTIGDNAFRDSRITEIRLPDNLTTIGAYFIANSRIASIEIPKKVNNISVDAFRETQNYLKSITVDPDNQYYSFKNNLMMDGAGEVVYFMVRLYGQSYSISITVPDGVKRIQSNAFYNSDLSSISFPSSLEMIETSAFQYCYNLKTVTFNNSPCEIGIQAFYNSGLSTLSLGNGVKKIYDSAFASCYNLTAINLPASLEFLAESAFNDCNNVSLVSVNQDNQYFSCMDNAVIVSKDYSILYYVATNIQRTLHFDANFILDFNNNNYIWRNTQFTGFEVDANNPVYASSGGFLLSKDKKNIYFGYRGSSSYNLNSSNIPSEVISISNYAFASCQALRKVDLTNTNISSIGYNAFESCQSLNSFIINDKVTALNSSLFSGCQSLTSITIPSTVTYVGDGAFWNTGLTSIAFPSSITFLGSNLFGACYNLVSADLSSCETITQLYGSMFSSCSKLTSVSLPQSIISIADWAFSDCQVLTSIALPSSLTSINSYAFNNCPLLKTVNFPSALNYIGSCAFQNCTALEEAVIDSLTELYNGVFANCTALKKVWLPKVVRYNSDSLAYCDQIDEMMVAPNVSRVTSSAFNNTTFKDIYVCGDYATYSSYTQMSRYFTLSKCKFYSQEAPTDTNYTYWHFSSDNKIQIWE